MKCIVIIVSYNWEKWITDCIESLKKSTVKPHILVIDCKSQDSTVTFLKEKYNQQLELIELNENLGFGKANNIGLKIAIERNYEVTFLMNQDTWVESDTLEVLMNRMKESPEFGILSPIHLNGSGKLLDHGFYKYVTKDQNRDFITDLTKGDTLLEIYQSDFINAAAWLINIEALKKTGGFNPAFAHYGEDVNWVKRLYYHGYLLGFCPNCFIFHDRENHIVSKLNTKFNVDFIMFLNQLYDPFQKNILKPVLLFLTKQVVFSFYYLLKLRFDLFSQAIKNIARLTILNKFLKFRKMQTLPSPFL